MSCRFCVNSVVPWLLWYAPCTFNSAPLKLRQPDGIEKAVVIAAVVLVGPSSSNSSKIVVVVAVTGAVAETVGVGSVGVTILARAFSVPPRPEAGSKGEFNSSLAMVIAKEKKKSDRA